MIYPVYNIFYSFFVAIALFFTSWRIQLYYRKTLSPLAKHFRDMSLSAGIGDLIKAFTFVLFANNPLALGIGAIIGGMFVFTAYVFGVVIFFYLVSPTVSSKKIITVGLALVVLVALCHIKFFSQPEINENGIIEFNFSPFTKIALFLFSTAGLLPLSIAFIREAVISRRLRIRSGFAAFALLFIAIANSFQFFGGVQHDPLAFLILPAIAYVMLIIAVILRVEATSV